MSRLSIIFATICYLLSFASVAYAGATYPQWWETQGVVLEQPPPASGEPGYDSATYDVWMEDNYAPANLGQAKHLAAAAFSTMEVGLAGSAGTGIADMVTGFSTAPEDNYVPLLIGQLKFLAEPFYNQMHTAGFTVTLSDGTVIADGNYPWAPSSPVADNYAPANLGQLKHIFSFDLTDWPPGGDDDGDGLLDDFEAAILASSGLGLFDPGGLLTGIAAILPSQPQDTTGLSPVQWDFDGDGIDNLTEQQQGTDPTDFYNGQAGDYAVALTAASIPAGPLGGLATPALSVEVRDSFGELVANAPVHLKPAVVSALLTTDPGGSGLTSPLTVLTDATGTATIYIQP